MFILSLILLIRSEFLRSIEIRNLKDRLEKLEHPSVIDLIRGQELQSRILDLEINSTFYLPMKKKISISTVVLLLLQHFGLGVKYQDVEASLGKLKRKSSKWFATVGIRQEKGTFINATRMKNAAELWRWFSVRYGVYFLKNKWKQLKPITKKA